MAEVGHVEAEVKQVAKQLEHKTMVSCDPETMEQPLHLQYVLCDLSSTQSFCLLICGNEH